MTAQHPAEQPAEHPAAAPADWIALVRRFFIRTFIGFAIAIPIGALIGYLCDGTKGLWGVVLGLLIPLIFFGITVACALIAAKWSPQALGVIVLGSYLVKMLVLIVLLWAISGSDFYSKAAFGIAVLVGTIGYLGFETRTMLKARIPYVEPKKTG